MSRWQRPRFAFTSPRQSPDSTRLERLVDLLPRGLRRVQRVDELHVVQQRALGRAEQRKDRVLQVRLRSRPPPPPRKARISAPLGPSCTRARLATSQAGFAPQLARAHLRALALRHLDHEVVLLLVQVGPLRLDHGRQQLRLEALLLDGKVDNHDLGADLGRVVRVGQLGRDVQPA